MPPRGCRLQGLTPRPAVEGVARQRHPVLDPSIERKAGQWAILHVGKRRPRLGRRTRPIRPWSPATSSRCWRTHRERAEGGGAQRRSGRVAQWQPRELARASGATKPGPRQESSPTRRAAHDAERNVDPARRPSPVGRGRVEVRSAAERSGSAGRRMRSARGDARERRDEVMARAGARPALAGEIAWARREPAPGRAGARPPDDRRDPGTDHGKHYTAVGARGDAHPASARGDVQVEKSEHAEASHGAR